MSSKNIKIFTKNAGEKVTPTKNGGFLRGLEILDETFPQICISIGVITWYRLGRDFFCQGKNGKKQRKIKELPWAKVDFETRPFFKSGGFLGFFRFARFLSSRVDADSMLFRGAVGLCALLGLGCVA